MPHAFKERQSKLTIFVIFIFVLQMCLGGLLPAVNFASAVSIGTVAGLASEYCGDGIVNGQEECDDGNSIDDDACRNDCTLPAICRFALDAALVMDRSGSMGYNSRCDWWQLKCINKPACTSYVWQLNSTYDQTKSWCDGKNQSAPHGSVWTEYNPTKLVAAKQTANAFLDLFGVGDQSALVSFATDATLDKQLFNDHVSTQTAVNSLVALGATNIGDAIKLANNELTSIRINPLAAQVMILLTDGMANRPNGPGHGEYPADVAYALTQADVSAAKGIKIFTIGLGADVNATMLEQMAATTGGKYYFAPTPAELEDIFNQIAFDVCQYGSIAGCKYEDTNNNGQIDPGEPTIPGWEIILEDDATRTQATDLSGCFKFSAVPLGFYTLREGGKTGVVFEQTYPLNNYTINLVEPASLTGYDFGNYIPSCGNNIIDNGYAGYSDEQCDDGNDINTDACTNSCLWPYCGDGIISQGEKCDDANLNNNDDCLNNCTLPACGDGYIWSGHETCDDNGDNGKVCTPPYGGNCSYCSDICEPVTLDGPYCGDGTKNGPEECDGADGLLPHYTCSPTCHLVYEPYCGDGIVNEPQEQCDDGNQNNNDGCLNTCLLASCGDGIVNQPSEECDDGNKIDTDGCTNNCLLPECGDGIVSSTEDCDDANQNNNDDCLNNCTQPSCGDGYVWAGHETCDDNGNNGQVCAPAYSSQCSYCSELCKPVTLFGPYCGDSLKNGPEQCDGTDGLLPHYTCSAVCTLTYIPYCGDGIVDGPQEQCDDANQNNEDDCRNDCSIPPPCDFDLDIMMVIDRSGSMDYSSRCDWWQLACVNKPICSSYVWKFNTTYNQTKSWCDARNQSAPHQSVWTEYNPNKFIASKDTANGFLSIMSLTDQSGLVSFANSATLDKQLSNNHPATKTAVNSLVAIGATNIGDAIKLATGELTSARINPEAEQVMILLTDGMANKPSGPGFGEYGPDVDYALAQAAAAAAAGIKIFTIGLDSEINAVMLEQIADMTGGEYYFAPSADELDDVFAALKEGICESGPYCGDGIKNCDEECDGTDGVGEHQSCSAICTLINLPYCGDGAKNGSEECDGTDGVSAHQTCSSTCEIINLPYCGNGVQDPGEECDDGNQGNTDNCLDSCVLPVCGDGYIRSGDETCDDGNTTNGDGCDSACQIEILPVCGNGAVETGEDCDDGNLDDNDGCSSSCMVEHAAIKAVKIVCPREADLPNWSDTGPNIDQTAIDNFLSAHPTCHVQAGWSFQWAYGEFTANPGDNIGEAPSPWQTFGPTVLTGLAEITVLLTGEKIWLREVMQNNYIPFTGVGGSDVSAEFYCHTDVSQYDNLDGIEPILAGETYYCVGFNVAVGCGNGLVEGSEQCDDGNSDDSDSCHNNCTLSASICLDLDGDGYGTGNDRSACLYTELDCSDDNNGIYPGATEICSGGLDEDCDGLIDCEDSDCGPKVVINEVAWMGTLVSSTDEWIELRNTTGEAIDLTGWTLNAQDGAPLINLAGTINANDYFLLERTDDDSVPGIAADQIYTGALEDSGEILELRNGFTNLIDTVDGGAGWPAGNGTIKQTMERYFDFNWYDSILPGGTPKAANGG